MLMLAQNIHWVVIQLFARSVSTYQEQYLGNKITAEALTIAWLLEFRYNSEYIIHL